MNSQYQAMLKKPNLPAAEKEFKLIQNAENEFDRSEKLRAETLKDIQPLSAEATGRPLRPRIIMNKIQEALK